MRGRLISIVFLSALFAALLLALGRDPAPAQFAESEYRYPPVEKDRPQFEKGFLFNHPPTPSAHSGTLLELPDGGLLAAWFAGSREGARDVAILAARWDGARWSKPFVLTDRRASERELGRSLRKLGNPVLYADARQRLWLFYVTVSSGGWSTSSISFKRSSDQGRTWEPARRLVTSPFANISTLVRTRPLAYADGDIALPVYHELAGKFSELLRLDPQGRVLSKARMSSGRSAIQPSVVALGPRRTQAFMRRVGNSPRRVLVSGSDDSGNHWSAPLASELPNPDASVAAVRSGDGDILLGYNDAERGRGRLSLARSRDGLRWRKLVDLEDGALDDEFSYPYLIRTRTGDYHLIYTWQRRRMAHVHFNQAWLDARQ